MYCKYCPTDTERGSTQNILFLQSKYSKNILKISPKPHATFVPANPKEPKPFDPEPLSLNPELHEASEKDTAKPPPSLGALKGNPAPLFRIDMAAHLQIRTCKP